MTLSAAEKIISEIFHCICNMEMQSILANRFQSWNTLQAAVLVAKAAGASPGEELMPHGSTYILHHPNEITILAREHLHPAAQ